MSSESKYRSVAVIGCGTIGIGWATFFLAKGLDVKIFDIDSELLRRAPPVILSNIELLVDKGLVLATIDAQRRLRLVSSPSELVEDVQYIQEAVCECYDTKKNVFKSLDALADNRVILASSSSGLLMSKIQEGLRNPERCIIAHPINPVHLIPLVEIVPGRTTGERAINQTREFLDWLGKVTVLVGKEVPGYIENRLTAALWREAIDLVLNGVASVEDIDKAIWAGPGLRYALMGPHMIYHLGGGPRGIRHFIEHLGDAFETWWKDMNTWSEFPKDTVVAIEKGVEKEMGSRTFQEMVSWRDERICDLIKAIYGSMDRGIPSI
jgi:carnitine 3-dehydrogenase